MVADELYSAGRENNLDVRLRALVRKLNRQFLHAEQLGFRHPQTGEQMRFTAPLPPDLLHFLETMDLT